MHEGRRERLAEFVTWTAAHITGDEKGQAQLYLDRLFQAFGQTGSLEVGGTPEMRVRKPAEDGGGTGFADYVWKPVVLIERKIGGLGGDPQRAAGGVPDAGVAGQAPVEGRPRRPGRGRAGRLRLLAQGRPA